MTIKPFAIQGADLTLGGVNLQAGTTGIVIPGVTQATSYKVEEVNDTGDQTFSNFPLDTEGEVVVIDAALYDTIVAQGDERHFADYTVTTDGEGYIDEIQVSGQGAYTGILAGQAQSFDMYAYIGAGSASARPLVPNDWIQIPFRPRMRAGAVETIGGGGGAGVVERSVNYPFGESGDTQGTLANDNGTLYFCYQDFVGTDPTVITAINSSDGSGSGQQYDNAWFDLSDGDNSDISDFVAANWNLIQNGNGMSTEVSVDGGDTWFSSVGVSYYPGDNPPTFIVTYNQVNQPQPGDEVEVRFIALTQEIWLDISNGISGANLGYLEVDDYTLVDREETDNFLSLAQGNDHVRLATSHDKSIYLTTNHGRTAPYSSPQEGANTWEFDSTGALTFPDGTVQTTAYIEQSNVSDSNIWIQTFVTDDVTDIPQVAISVEYDSDGNIIALFDHTDTDPPNSRYFSVGKFSRTGNRVWTTRIAAGVNTDGWGLAVESGSGDVYITGSNITGDGGAYTQSMLTKLSASNGSVVWSRIYDFGFESTIGVVDIEAGGNVGMVGFASDGSNDYITTTKISAEDGSVMWSRKIDGQEDERAYGMAVSSIGEIVVVGWMSQLAGVDNDQRMVVVKYDSTGTVTWQKAIQFDAGYNCFGADADIDSNGNIYICGSFYIPGGPSTQAMAIFKFNSSGDKQWSRRVQGSCSAAASSIVVGPDDRLYISGVTYDPTPNTNWVVAKYKEDGLVDWQRLIVNTAGNMSFAGQSFIGNGGGSNIAVRDGYVALGGGFGDITAGPDGVHAALVQVSTDGTTFAAGDWDFTDAGFSGTLDSSASDITVIEAGLTDSANETLESTTINPEVDGGVFLLGTTVRPAGITNSLKNGSNTFTLNADGSISFPDGTRQSSAYPGATTYLLNEYNTPDPITTPTEVAIDGMDYGAGEVVQDGAFGPNSSRVTLYADSMFAMIAVDADITTVYYNGNVGADGDGTKAVIGGLENYRGYYAYYNLFSGTGDPAISQIVIAKSNTISGSNATTDTNNDDYTVTGLGGSNVIIVLNVYWASANAPYNSSIDVAVSEFIDNVIFDEGTERTDINAMKDAFYANSALMKTNIQANEGDLLYENFEFYKSFRAVRPTGGNGIGAVLEIESQAINGYNDRDVIVPGVGYRQGDLLNVPGTVFGGASPKNDISIYVNSVDANGGITGFDTQGTVFEYAWPTSYIIDGDDDQYDIGNIIGTNRTRATATVTIAVEDNGNSYQTFYRLTVAHTDKPVKTEQWIWLTNNDTNGCIINWQLPADTTTADLIGDGAEPTVGLKRVIYTNTYGYQGGEDESAMVGAGNYSGFAIGDTITFRNGEVRTISAFDGDYIEWSGVVAGTPSNSTGDNPRYPLTLTTSNYADTTKSTVRIKPDAVEADNHDQYMKVYAGYNVVPPNPPMDNLHIHMAGGQENVELFLGTDNNFVSAKEAGNSPAAVNLKSENDINVINTNLRLTRKGSSWVSIYGDGENQNIRNQDPMGWVRDLTWNAGAVDENGDYYVGGEAMPQNDAIISKFSRDGSLIWSKYNDAQESQGGWNITSVAYHNGVVASLATTDFDEDNTYIKLTEHDSATGEHINSKKIYDPQGDIYAYQMIHHSTLGWTIVGKTYGEDLSTGSLTATGDTGLGIVELPISGTQVNGQYPNNYGPWRILGTGLGPNGVQLDLGLGLYQDVPVITVTGAGSGGRAKVQVIYSSNTYSAIDFSAGTGTGYVDGDQVKILGSTLSGVDGDNDMTITVQAVAGQITGVYSSSGTAAPTKIRVDLGYFAGFGSTNFRTNVTTTAVAHGGFGAWKATDDGAGNFYLIFLDSTTVTDITGKIRVGDTITFDFGGTYHTTTIAAALDVVPNDPYIASYPNSRGYRLTNNFDQTGQSDYNVGSLTYPGTFGTFTFKRTMGERAFVWTDGWKKYLEPDVSTQSTTAYSVAENPSTGGLVVGGGTTESENGGAFIWNLAENGTTTWVRTIGYTEPNTGGDNNAITSLAVNQMGQIYAANSDYINRIEADGLGLYRRGTAGMFGSDGGVGISVQLEDDGKEYVYYGFWGGSAWQANGNQGFYLNKFTTDLKVVWGRTLDSYLGALNINYDRLQTPIIFGKNQVTMFGYASIPSGNYTNAYMATMSTDDHLKNYDEYGWRILNRSDMAWGDNFNYRLNDYIDYGATAVTSTVVTLIDEGSLDWYNYTYQSQVLNFNNTSKGIVGVEQIDFVNGGVLDHNPSDIPPSLFFNPQFDSNWIYMLQLSDRGRFILNQTIPNLSECADLEIIVPSNESVPFPVGTVITLINASSEAAIGGGFKIQVTPENYWTNSDRSPQIWTTGGNENWSTWSFKGIQTATLMKISTNGWILTCNNPTNED